MKNQLPQANPFKSTRKSSTRTAYDFSDPYEDDPPEKRNSSKQDKQKIEVPMVETDMGTKVPVPHQDVYPGEAPYGAPLAGFHGKIGEVFDAVAILPLGYSPQNRPKDFFPVIGLKSDDEQKNDNPAWTMYARLRPEIYQQVKAELGDIQEASAKPVILASSMRADGMALLSLSQPHQMFAPCLWLATLPESIMTYPLPTIDEQKVLHLANADRARAELEQSKKAELRSRGGEQLSLKF